MYTLEEQISLGAVGTIHGELKPIKEVTVYITSYVEYGSAVWCASVSTPYMYSLAHTKEDALFALETHISEEWDKYAHADDSVLTPSGVIFKHKLLATFRE